LVARVFATAREKFAETLENPAYQAMLPARLEEAMACVGDRAVPLRAHPRLAAALARPVGERATIREDPAVGAGFRAVTEDGTLEVDCTLEARLQTLTPILSLELLKQAVQES
jgi:vacuolar-type H+-ATPase subunit E/Vma4